MLAFLIDGPESERHDLETTWQWALKVGENNLKGLSLLDKAHQKRFGVPTPTQVSTTPVPGKVVKNESFVQFLSLIVILSVSY